ncbi:hypothetical protein ACJRO7_004473 [Eucalyptus globulus]|uniref:GDP-D-glucose phosphorylase 1 n=1 Tax=Eucalyptus globulus TaxID=34317 RepID=A0ABD3IZZ6_EUCGL
MHGFIDVHWLLMNKVVKLLQVSPIEYGHVLLIARVLDCLPQRIDHMSFFLALSLAKEAADRFSRMGYNSLGTFATINHLHFQGYYLASPFPVEKVPTLRVMTSTSMQRYAVVVSQLLKFPVRSLVFEGGDTLWDLSSAVANSCILLQHNNIPFNILIADCGKRVFLFPQQQKMKLKGRRRLQVAGASEQICWAPEQDLLLSEAMSSERGRPVSQGL